MAHLPSPGSLTVIQGIRKGRDRKKERRGKEGRLVRETEKGKQWVGELG